MPTPIPLNFRSSPLPADFAGNPQQFLEAIVARITAESAVNISFFVSGPTAPTSDYGPWLKNGLTWWTFDTVTGAYVPQPLEQQSLKYIAGATPPSPSQYIFWIELDGTGKAQAIKYYSGGAWKDVYEDKFALYSTTVQMNAAIAAAYAVPVGSQIEYAGSVAPAGWLWADGSAVSRITYAALFNVIGVIWGAGDGVNTFNLPRTPGCTGVGIGTGNTPGATTWTLGEIRGTETHVLTQGELPAVTIDTTMQMYDEGGAVDNNIANGGGIANKQVTISVGPLGSGFGHNNIQPSYGIMKIIKT